MDIFEYQYNNKIEASQPLAAKVRPKTLEDFVGQHNILGKSTVLYNAIKNDNLLSIILYGPPGCGKTTIAKIISTNTKSHFVTLNATTSGVKDIKEIVQNAKDRLSFSEKKTIVFIDEIHRFNKSQQDTLLPYVEDGVITIIGATTENPYFEVNKALLSRSTVFSFTSLTDENILEILNRAVKITGIKIENSALKLLAELSGGDARYALNGLELAFKATAINPGSIISVDNLKAALQTPIKYDKNGEDHYNTISAFIKSLRGSDPDAAIFYLGRMLAAGEDPKFIARRIVIAASEDVGNADPQALVIATAAAQSVSFIGMPESRIILAQATIYIATAPKSNSSYNAINEAIKDATKPITIPPHLKNINLYEDSLEYKYPHNYPNGFVQQQYMPNELLGNNYYRPKNIGYEQQIKKYLEGKTYE